jgi:hypothetical protein
LGIEQQALDTGPETLTGSKGLLSPALSSSEEERESDT